MASFVVLLLFAAKLFATFTNATASAMHTLTELFVNSMFSGLVSLECEISGRYRRHFMRLSLPSLTTASTPDALALTCSRFSRRRQHYGIHVTEIQKAMCNLFRLNTLRIKRLK